MCWDHLILALSFDINFERSFCHSLSFSLLFWIGRPSAIFFVCPSIGHVVIHIHSVQMIRSVTTHTPHTVPSVAMCKRIARAQWCEVIINVTHFTLSVNSSCVSVYRLHMIRSMRQSHSSFGRVTASERRQNNNNKWHGSAKPCQVTRRNTLRVSATIKIAWNACDAKSDSNIFDIRNEKRRRKCSPFKRTSMSSIV